MGVSCDKRRSCLTGWIGDQRARLKLTLGGSNARLREDATPGTLRPAGYGLAAPRVARRAKRGAQGRNPINFLSI